MEPSVPSSSLSSKSELRNKEYKKLTFNNEFYEGHVLLNNLHGRGFFSTQKNGQKLFYDGLFYVNKLEGYCQIFYENGTHFQGLFKQHKRYGPGVLTYPNETQDVGFWDGFKLVRLASVVGADTIPQLVTTVLGKTKLLYYRYLVPLCEEHDDVVKNIFTSIDLNKEVLERSDDVLNFSIRNPNSLFFPKNFYDYHFFGGKDCTIKVAFEEKDSVSSVETEIDVYEEDPFNRINQLISKIKEVNEKLEPFLAIKQNLLEKINYCTNCCAPIDSSINISKECVPSPQSHILTPIIPSALRTEDDSTVDVSSFRPDGSYFGSYTESVASLSTSEINEGSRIVSDKSTKQIIMEFCTCGEQREIEDLEQLEDQLANIMKQELFYRNIRDSLQMKVDKLIKKEEDKLYNPEPEFKLVEVTELWAWNNEELLMQIQKHCFKHRNSEKMVNFSVPNLILGNRKDFGDIGVYEAHCRQFLIACGKGKKDLVRRCLREKVNPNISDARGNSGIFFAATKDQIEIISILTNSGAKLDQINDEELTPLSLCLLKYLSQKYKCTSWEKAFFTATEVCQIVNPPKWYDVEPFLSSSSTPTNSMERMSSQNDYSLNSRIIELFRRLSNIQQSTSLIRNVPNTSYVFDLSFKKANTSEKQVEMQNNEHLQNALKATHLTIMTLLDYGADPNLAKVPYPPLVLSLFSENPDLVAELLEASADVNVVVTNDNLSCLHIISSLKISNNNVEICRLLLMFKCDANLKTLPSHWQDQKSYFIGDIPQEISFEDLGKNALHLLCMRKDFENDDNNYQGLMCMTLYNGGIDCNESYLGHSPLSLAVLTGNIRLVKYLIKLNIFDPYKSLDYHMGNILTLFTLKRFENILPTDTCKAMLIALVECDVNVLNKVGNSENAIDFAEKGDAIFNSKTSVKDDKNMGKGKAKPASKAKKVAAQSVVIIEVLKDLARYTIIRQIQMIGTEILYDFTEENILLNNEEDILLNNEEDTLLNNEVAVALAEFLTPRILIKNLELLFHDGKIDLERENKNHIKSLLKFVNLHQKLSGAKKGIPKEQLGKKGKTVSYTPDETMDDLLAGAIFKKSGVLHSFKSCVVIPGFDDPSIYKVCFHCLKGKDKELKICPRCQMIRFCSIQCNRLNLKYKTLHTCNVAFYEMTDEEIQDLTPDKSLLELAKTAKENCRMRLHKKRELKLVEEERKLLEMWRADTYGTKFLKFRPMLKQASKKRKGTKLGFNMSGLKTLLERNFQKNPADFESYNIEVLLDRLNSQQKIRERSKSVRSSMGHRLGSRVGSLFSDFLAEFKQRLEEKQICRCPEKSKHTKQKRKDTKDKSPSKKQDSGQKGQLDPMKLMYIKDSMPGQFEDLYAQFSVRERDNTTMIRKLQKIPSKYQRFIEILGTYFPDVDVSSWLLPYACCSNGQLFYKFCNNEIFRESYSLS